MWDMSPPSPGPWAERLTAEGSFGPLRRHFPTVDHAFAFFAARQAERYSFDRVGDQCFGCGRRADGGVVQAVWDYPFPSVRATLAEALGVFGHVHTDRHRHGSFVTYHAACRACMRWWRVQRAGAAVALGVAVTALAIGGVLAVLGSIFYVGGTFSPADRRQLRLHIPIAAATAVLGGPLWALGSRWYTPGPLRRVARRPVDLKEMRRRSADELRAAFEALEAWDDEDD
jgi:hypothetical protein